MMAAAFRRTSTHQVPIKRANPQSGYCDGLLRFPDEPGFSQISRTASVTIPFKMHSEIQIRPLRTGGLEVRVRERRKKLLVLFNACAVLFALAFWLSPFLHVIRAILLGLLVAVLVFVFLGFGATEDLLKVTKVEFTSTARRKVGRGTARTTVVTNTADVRWLEYRNADKWGIFGLQTPGLYAVKKSNADCLLPHLDWEETSFIIKQIESAVPGLAEMWRNNLAATGSPVQNR